MSFDLLGDGVFKIDSSEIFISIFADISSLLSWFCIGDFIFLRKLKKLLRFCLDESGFFIY